MAKYKRLRRHRRRAEQGLRRVARRQPGLFAHWRSGMQGLNDKSRMSERLTSGSVSAWGCDSPA